MSEYERITMKNGLLDCAINCGNEMSCIGCARNVTRALERLAELEDKIEAGTLIFIDEPFYSERDNCWAVFQRVGDNISTCKMTEQQAKDYRKNQRR